jgi:hypothetical protein
MSLTADDFEDNRFIRLSDRILFAFEMALEQHDLDISDALARALELSMTRNTGGGDFIERRDYPEEINVALDRLSALKKQHRDKSA